MSETAIHTAVITGHHAFDLPVLARLFRELPGVDAYIQHVDDFAANLGKLRDWYDVLVFYTFHQETPGPAEADPWWGKGQRAALERLGATEQGIVLLHHGLLPIVSGVSGMRLLGSGTAVPVIIPTSM